MRVKRFLFAVVCIYSLAVTQLLIRYRVNVGHNDIDIRAVGFRKVTTTVAMPNASEGEGHDHRYYADRSGDEKAVADEEELAPTAAGVVHPGYFLLDSDEPFTLRCGRCALVSSSGHLYQSGAGADIDSADCVLRMNTATVVGWEEDVGSRTDIRIIGNRNLPRGLVKEKNLETEIMANETTRTKYIVVPWLYEEKINSSTDVYMNLARDFKTKYPHVDYVFLKPAKHEESETRYRLETGYKRKDLNAWFSTGFVSVIFALDVCDSLDVYGLPNSEFCSQHPDSRVPYHYYSPKGPTECSTQRSHENRFSEGHKFMTERAMFARWSLIYNMKFHYPSWKATIQNATARVDTPFLRKYREALESGKLKDLQGPRYIMKNGKRFRIVRKVIRKKPAPAVKSNSSKTQ